MLKKSRLNKKIKNSITHLNFKIILKSQILNVLRHD